MGQENESDLFRKGKDCYEKGMIKKAHLLLTEVIEINPKNIEAFFLLGNIFYMEGQVGKGIKAFKKVLELNPDHTDASICLAVMYNDIGKYEDAKSIFDKASKRIKGKSVLNGIDDPHINKRFSIKHYELGGLYLSYNRFDEALFEFNKAISLDPKNLDCRLKIAKIYAKKGYILKAIEELKKLKNEFPAFLPARVALGVIYFGSGNIIEAQNEWKKILAKDPTHSEANMYLSLSNTATEISLDHPINRNL